MIASAEGISPDRLPPQNLDAERSVIGSLLRDNTIISDVIQIVRADNFYYDAHRKVFAAIIEIYDAGHPIDLVILADKLKTKKELDDVGSYRYLSELWEAAPTAANAEYYAKIVREKAIVRSLIHAGNEILRDCYEQASGADEMLGGAERKILEIAEKGTTGQTWTISEALTETYKRIDQRTGRKDPNAISGLSTGYTDLDQITAGLQQSELIILAARPSVGKTAFSLNLVRHAIVEEKAPAFFVSLEQSKVEIAERLLAMQSKVDAQKLRKGFLSADDMQKLIMAGDVLRNSPLYIDDTPAQGMLRIAASARRLKLRAGIRLIVIDYLQLIDPEDKRQPRQEQVAQISRRLKFLARELSIPVMALAQVNRASEDRQDHRPRLADLRESGCLAGDTLIPLADGGRAPIRELVGRSGFNVWALDEVSLTLKPAEVSRAFSTGVKPVFRLETKLGRSVRATANHPFLTFGGWRRLDELRPGDRVALPRHLPTPDRAATMSDAEVSLLGLLLGDGCTLPGHAIQYTTADLDLADDAARLASEAFGDSVSPRVSPERGWYQVYLAAASRLTHGKRNPIAAWLDRLGVFGQRSYEKFVPNELFGQPANTIGRFLSHLWATDGCIRAPRPGGSTRHPAIYYGSSSPRLASDVQALLLRVGINAVLRPRDQKGKGRTQYHVLVMGRGDVLRFAERIGATGLRKNRELLACVEYLRGRSANGNRDTIPASAWRALVPAMARNGVTMRAMQAGLGSTFCGSTLYKANIGRARMARVVSAVGGDDRLAALASSDVYWDEVRTIDPAGTEEVFDLTVPGPHNFVADDIIVHNSIEQDADTCMMLHRPGKFDQGQEDNIIEVIVAKQRNGPTGEVTLSYMKQFMRYENHAADGAFSLE